MTPEQLYVAGAQVGVFAAEGVSAILMAQRGRYTPSLNVWSRELLECLEEEQLEEMAQKVRAPGAQSRVDELLLYSSYARLYTERVIRAVDLCRSPATAAVTSGRSLLLMGQMSPGEFVAFVEKDSPGFVAELQVLLRAYDEELRVLQGCMMWQREQQIAWHKRTLEQLPDHVQLQSAHGDSEQVVADIVVCKELAQRLLKVRRLAPQQVVVEKMKRKQPTRRAKEKPQSKKKKKRRRNTPPSSPTMMTRNKSNAVSAPPAPAPAVVDAFQEELLACEQSALDTLSMLERTYDEDAREFLLSDVAPPKVAVDVAELLEDVDAFRGALSHDFADAKECGSLARMWDLARRALNTHALMEHLRAKKRSGRFKKSLPQLWDSLVQERNLVQARHRYKQASKYDALGSFLTRYPGFMYQTLWVTLDDWRQTFQGVNRCRALEQRMTPVQKQLWSSKESLEERLQEEL